MSPTAALTVSDLVVYPVKSCAGTSFGAVDFDGRGMLWDRRWMVVSAAGRFMSQRRLPRMALIRPRVEEADDGAVCLHLAARGTLDLKVPLVRAGDGSAELKTVTVWDDEIEGAVDQGGRAARWLSAFLGVDGLRLVHMGPACRRLVSPKYSVTENDELSFADGMPVLIASEASLAELNRQIATPGAPLGMERFRPNVVVRGEGLVPFEEDTWQELRLPGVTFHIVKPCCRKSRPVAAAGGAPRPEPEADAVQPVVVSAPALAIPPAGCNMTQVEQNTGVSGGPRSEPLRTLRRFRATANGEVFFGQNIVVAGDGGRARRDDSVEVVRRGPPNLVLKTWRSSYLKVAGIAALWAAAAWAATAATAGGS